MKNPTKDKEGLSYRVLRGGQVDNPQYVRLSYRDDNGYSTLRDDYLGFRIARSKQ